jgi:hypothetical protein
MPFFAQGVAGPMTLARQVVNSGLQAAASFKSNLHHSLSTSSELELKYFLSTRGDNSTIQFHRKTNLTEQLLVCA